MPEIATTEPVKGEIEARELTFRYPGTDRDVLKDISFHIEPGQTLGIVGRTGAGKTTLVNLMLRIIDPDDDMLYIGGREIHTIPLQTLRASTGYVMQDNFLFPIPYATTLRLATIPSHLKKFSRRRKWHVCTTT